MLRVRIVWVRESELPRLRAWMRELVERLDEVRETFVQEGTRHEQVHLVRTADGPLLVYVIEVEDAEAAEEAYLHSTLPIDLEHREVMRSVVAGPADSEVLLDATSQ